jgi:hypothetical protein
MSSIAASTLPGKEIFCILALQALTDTKYLGRIQPKSQDNSFLKQGKRLAIFIN